MPESESKPKLIELIGPGTGQGWKAVLRNGKPAVVHEIPVPPAEATAAVPRLQRLFEHRHPALSPVLAWGTDQRCLGRGGTERGHAAQLDPRPRTADPTRGSRSWSRRALGRGRLARGGDRDGGLRGDRGPSHQQWRGPACRPPGGGGASRSVAER